MRCGKEHRPDSPERWNAWSKGPPQITRVSSHFIRAVSLGRPPGSIPGRWLRISGVRMARRLGARLSAYAILCRFLPGRRRGRRRRRLREGEENGIVLSGQIARMLSGRDSNYYYHLLATGIALPRMIIRGDAPRLYGKDRFAFRGPTTRAATLLLIWMRFGDCQRCAILRNLAISYLRIVFSKN